jgi:hypothetical protein
MVVEAREVGVIVVLKRQLAGFRTRLRVDQGTGAILALEFLESGLGVGIGRIRHRMFARAWNTGSEAFNLTDGHAAAGDLLGEVETHLRIGDGEKCASVTGRDPAFFDQLLDGRFELQETDGVGDRGPVFAGALGDLLLREMKFVGEALESVRLLDGVQIFALEVLYEGHLHRHTLGYVADDDGNAMHFSALGSTPSAFPSDELIASAPPTNDERLDDAT